MTKVFSRPGTFSAPYKNFLKSWVFPYRLVTRYTISFYKIESFSGPYLYGHYGPEIVWTFKARKPLQNCTENVSPSNYNNLSSHYQNVLQAFCCSWNDDDETWLETLEPRPRQGPRPLQEVRITVFCDGVRLPHGEIACLDWTTSLNYKLFPLISAYCPLYQWQS